MDKKLLAPLFICTLIPWTLGNGLLPLLPIYAIELGANQAVAGYFMSFAYLSLAIGAPIAGWLSDRFQRRKVLIISVGIVNVPIVFLLSKAKTVWQLAALTGISWFLLGMGLALLSTIAGLFADKTDRGKIFGLLGSSVGVGAIIGGLATGPMVDRWGYPMMFVALSAIAIILPISGLFLKDKVVSRSRQSNVHMETIRSRFGIAFILLLLAHGTAMVVNGVAQMGRSLVMNGLNFTSTAITSTMAIAGIILIPIPLLIGWLSDRMERKLLMIVCYSAFTFCMLVLYLSRSLWHFWIVAVFISIGFISNTVGPAMVTDLVQQNRLGLGMSLFQAMFWVGNVIGFAVAGLLIQILGMPTTFMLGMIPPIVAIVLLVQIKTVRKKATT